MSLMFEFVLCFVGRYNYGHEKYCPGVPIVPLTFGYDRFGDAAVSATRSGRDNRTKEAYEQAYVSNNTTL